jgi:hypothetical protein
MTLIDAFISTCNINERICGACGESKCVDNFYRDGKSKDGTIKYRRDCKDCYRKQRLKERRHKREKVQTVRRSKGRK